MSVAAADVGPADSGPLAQQQPADLDEQPGTNSAVAEKASGSEVANSRENDRLTPELQKLRPKLDRVLDYYISHCLNTRDNDCWELMHAIIAYGVKSQVHRESPQGPLANSIGWLCYNYPCNGENMLYLDRGRVQVRRGVGVQGHPGQFLAIVAQSHVAPTFPVMVEGRKFALADVIESEKLGCQTGIELTFKLISLSHYLDTDARWKNAAGEEWSISRLLKEEIAAPINGAACGGTHRLMGLSYAVRKRTQYGRPIEGEFRRAKIYTTDFHRYTYSLQNADGSFSTEWFNGPGARPDSGRRVQTTGHILEWLAFSVPEDELTDPRMIKAVNYLADLLISSPGRNWEVGPLGHALHALVIYRDRAFGPHAPAQSLAVRGQSPQPLPQVEAPANQSEQPMSAQTYPVVDEPAASVPPAESAYTEPPMIEAPVEGAGELESAPPAEAPAPAAVSAGPGDESDASTAPAPALETKPAEGHNRPSRSAPLPPIVQWRR